MWLALPTVGVVGTPDFLGVVGTPEGCPKQTAPLLVWRRWSGGAGDLEAPVSGSAVDSEVPLIFGTLVRCRGMVVGEDAAWDQADPLLNHNGHMWMTILPLLGGPPITQD